MAFADPQSVIVEGTTPVSLPRTEFGARRGVFTSSDGKVSMVISHQGGAKGSARRLVSVSRSKIASDPLTSVNTEVSATAHAVLTAPRAGFTIAELTDLLEGLSSLLNDSTFATKFIGGEA